jgi:WD40 repeat protein
VVSDDGSVVLSGGSEGQTFLWHIAQPGGPTSEPFIRRFKLPGHSKSSMVKACCVSADGLWAATGGNDGNILLWDLAGLSPDTDSNNAPAAGADAAAAADAAQLAGQVSRAKAAAAAAAAAAEDADAVVDEPAAPQPVQLSALLQLPKGEQVCCLDLSRDGSWLAVGSRSGKVYLLPHGSTELQQLPSRHQDGYKVRCCALSPDGSKLLSAAEDARLVLWDVVSGSCVLSVHEHFKPIRGCCWSPDGRHIVTVGGCGGWDASGFDGKTNACRTVHMAGCCAVMHFVCALLL